MAKALAPSLTQLERSVVALAIKDADAGFVGPAARDTNLRAKLQQAVQSKGLF